jgi:RimJ/RimL family protein N-acetyltransferase
VEVVVHLETDRFWIRDLCSDDAAFVLELTNEPAFIANIGNKGLETLEDAVQFLAEGSWTCQPKPGYGQFLVELKGSGDPVGVCGLLYRDSLDVTDVGFAMLSQHRGRGYASEAAEAVMQYGYSDLGVEEIVGLTSAENLPSIRVLEKLGMKFDRMVKMRGDGAADTALYRNAECGLRRADGDR